MKVTQIPLAEKLKAKAEGNVLALMALIPIKTIEQKLFQGGNPAKLSQGNSVSIEIDIDSVFKQTDNLGMSTAERNNIINKAIQDWAKANELIMPTSSPGLYTFKIGTQYLKLS